MKVAILADTHFGVRNDMPVFYPFFEKFYSDLFFPELKKRGIKHLIHLGDVCDRRRYINFNTLSHVRKVFFDPLRENGIETKIIIGNHDIYWRTTNELNSPNELFRMYENVELFTEPEETRLFGLPCLVLPWINPSNYEGAMELIKSTKRKIVFGHLEITGFNMYRGVRCEHGMDPSIFSKFRSVYTGHFHHRSIGKVVKYLGSPYEMMLSDYDDPRGFHIYDTETDELEFVQNPDRLFFRIEYDDSQTIPEIDEQWKDKFIRIIVKKKQSAYEFERFVTAIEAIKPFDISIVENDSLDIDEKVEEDTDGTMILDDTPSILNAYVDAVKLDVDKQLLKRMLLDIYLEASAKTAAE